MRNNKFANRTLLANGMLVKRRVESLNANKSWHRQIVSGIHTIGLSDTGPGMLELDQKLEPNLKSE